MRVIISCNHDEFILKSILHKFLLISATPYFPSKQHMYSTTIILSCQAKTSVKVHRVNAL